MGLLSLTLQGAGESFSLDDNNVVEILLTAAGADVFHVNKAGGNVMLKQVTETPTAIASQSSIVYGVLTRGGVDTIWINTNRITFIEDDSESKAKITYDGRGSAAETILADATLAAITAAITAAIVPDPGYLVYKAFLTQSGTGAPTATVLENTIGAIVWSRTSTGLYLATLAGAFTANKTVVKPPTNWGPMDEVLLFTASFSAGSDNINTVYVRSGQTDGVGGSVMADADDLLTGPGYSYFEILVYP